MFFGRSFALGVLLLGSAHSFPFTMPSLVTVPKIDPNLKRIGESQHGTELSFSIQISEERSFKWSEDPSYRPSFLAVKGLKVRLTDAPGLATMPGANGPRPHLSTGCCKVELLSPGSFMTMGGEVVLDIDPTTACWEAILREGAPAAQLVIGLDVKSEAVRNSASLPAGRLFLNVALWEPTPLATHREKLAEAEVAVRAINQRKDKALEEMHATPNPIMKALKFREACQAMEALDFNPHRSLKEEVPEDGDEALINGIHVVKTGTIWAKNTAFLPRSEHQFLGTCTMQVPKRE